MRTDLSALTVVVTGVAVASAWAPPGSWPRPVAPLGPVDVLVNNAGIMPVGPVLDEPDAGTRAVIDVNLASVIHGTNGVGPAMHERGRGHIINVASAVGRLALPNGATYAASKFAVVGFSEATRAELARWTQQMTRFTQMLPRRAQDALAGAFRADSLPTRADARVRADYEQRVRALGSDRPESRGTPPRED